MKSKKIKYLHVFSKRGQAIIETLSLAIIFTFIVKSFFVLFWIVSNKLWIEHQLYEALLCLSEKNSKILCKTKTMKNIKKLNPTGNFQNLKLLGFYNKGQASIEWKFYKWKFSIQNSLDLGI